MREYIYFLHCCACVKKLRFRVVHCCHENFFMLRADQVIWIKFNPLFQTLFLLSRYFVESLLNVHLTSSGLFHSHLEYLPGLQRSEFSKQVRGVNRMKDIHCVKGLNSEGPVTSANHSTVKTLAIVPSTFSRLIPSPFSPFVFFLATLCFSFYLNFMLLWSSLLDKLRSQLPGWQIQPCEHRRTV